VILDTALTAYPKYERDGKGCRRTHGTPSVATTALGGSSAPVHYRKG